MSNITWFTEKELPYGKNGVKISLEVKEVIFDDKSKWGHIQVLDTVFYGKLLAIDGIVQVTESDEFIYHEMMAVLPFLQHSSPKNILIAGGGDGGVLKQATRLKSLEKVTQVEIDKVVSTVTKKYLPSICENAFTHTKTELVYDDAYNYIQNSMNYFDVIILDLTDPVLDGPAERLFSQEFLNLVKNRLAPQGIMVMQCGSLTFQPEEVKQLLTKAKSVFQHVRLHNAVVPSYQLTSFGFILASDFSMPVLSREKFESNSMNVSGNNKFLNFDMYQASIALPEYLKQSLEAE